MDRQLSPVTTPSENEKLLLLSGALILSAGITRFNKPKRVNAALPAGVKTVVLLSGRVQIRCLLYTSDAADE